MNFYLKLVFFLKHLQHISIDISGHVPYYSLYEWILCKIFFPFPWIFLNLKINYM